MLALVAIPSAQAQSALSAKGFVQSFYTWYIPQMTKNVPVPSDRTHSQRESQLIQPNTLSYAKGRPGCISESDLMKLSALILTLISTAKTRQSATLLAK
jgi:hypothetical protein